MTAPKDLGPILGKLKRDAEAHLSEPVTQAVITVSAYFDDAQRTATKEAGRSPTSTCCASSTSPPALKFL